MKLVEIPISRFQAEVPLSRDTFIFLPLNNKAIRIGLASEAISAPMLAKLRAKGHTHLRIAEESEIDPATFPVHEQLPPGPTPNLPLMPGEAIHANANSGEPTAVEPETLLGADAPPAEASTVILPELPAEEPAQAFSADSSQSDTSRVNGTAESAEDEVRLEADGSQKDPESRFNGKSDEETVSRTISAKEEAAEKYVRKFATEKNPLPAVFRLQKKMAEADQSDISVDLRQEKELALKEARTVILSSKISEKIISLSERARKAEPSLRESLRGQVKNLKSALDQVDGGDLSLEDKPEFQAKEEIAQIVDSLSSASRADQVEEITERLSAHAFTREMAMAAMEEEENLGEKEPPRGTNGRDLPATVSRLAAYLGHSLGYTSVDFLADLGCGAIAYFAKKDGETLDEDQLPPFTKKIISSDEARDDATTDSRDILQFLEAYIGDQECDRSHRDLMKKVFDRTMQSFSEKDDGPSALSLRKWSSFVDRGPTIDSHSICTRASAKAVKQARSALR